MTHRGGWSARMEMEDDRSIDRSMLRRVFAYARPYRARIVVLLGFILVQSVLGVVPALLSRELIDGAIAARDLRRLTVVGLLMVAVPLVGIVVGTAQRWISAVIGESIIFDLRTSAFAHLQRMSLRFFTSTRTGELISRLNTDVVGAQQAVTGTMVSVTSNVLSVLVAMVVMIGTDWRLTLLAVAALPLFLIPARLAAGVLRRVTRSRMQHDAVMSAVLQETLNISGALLVKIFGRADTELDRYSAEADAVRRLGVQRALVGRWLFAGLGLVSALGSAAVFWAGGWMVINEVITLGQVVMFVTLTSQLYQPLTALTNARVEFTTSLVSFERVFEVLDLEAEITDPPDPVTSPIEGGLRFDDVWFRYTSDEFTGLESVQRYGRRGYSEEVGMVQTAAGREWALADISFDAEPGQVVAVVGPSGAGKTTLSYLVPRLYDVDRGAVLIDGVDVRRRPLAALADAVGVVTQETYLFHDTILNNLRYADPEATESQVVEACRAANIHEFIASLPDGYHTRVGERGHRLSGGEKQRIAIARVILKNPRILVLDEATAHLDSQSEALIQDALTRVMSGRTSIVIAHRLSTVRMADRILVLEAGRLVESGDHEHLMAVGGLYARLHNTQFGVTT